MLRPTSDLRFVPNSEINRRVYLSPACYFQSSHSTSLTFR